MATTTTNPQAQAAMAAPIRLEWRDDGIAFAWIEAPAQSHNTLGREMINAAGHVLDEVERDNALRGLVFISAKSGSFIAGADINMIRDCGSAEEAAALSRTGQRIFARLSEFKVPVAAAIDGTCLGGGLELALACHARVCSAADHTRLGLPEVQLGLLPGGGGTQRLPRLIGVPAALDLMLTGRQVRPGKARRLGLVDDVVPAAILERAAVKRIEELHLARQANSDAGRREPGVRERLTRWAIEGNPLGRGVVCAQARKRLHARTHGNYPAPARIIDCVESGLAEGMANGLEAEASSFGELAMTPEARELVGIYFATTAMKKDTGVDAADVRPRDVRRVAVLGGGLMGAGVSAVTAGRAAVPVRLKDVSAEGLAAGLRHVREHADSRRRRGSLSAFATGLLRRRVTPTLDFSGFARVDLVIEAVFEDLELKRRLLADIERECGGHTIFASNTSAIPISRIADEAARPGNVIGMHYFSPVEKMPLLEVIAHEGSDPAVIATAVAFGRRQGKTPIVVRDGAGFYVNRILAPYVNEAVYLLGEGVAIDRIDRTLVRFGFPVGPFKLLDEVGIDISAHVAPILHQAFGERMRPNETSRRMIDDGRLGKKAGRGFYRYGGRHPGREVDQGVYELLEVSGGRAVSDDEIVQRTVGMMVNEAVRCLDEGILRSARDGDIGAVFGIGFPPFRGGPFRYLDAVGAGGVHWWLESLRKQHGERFAPAPGLERRASQGERFHPPPVSDDTADVP